MNPHSFIRPLTALLACVAFGLVKLAAEISDRRHRSLVVASAVALGANVAIWFVYFT